MSIETVTQTTFGNGSGINPEITIGSILYVPQTGNYTRKLFTREQYSGEKLEIHSENTDAVYLLGRNTYFFYRMSSLMASSSDMPSFMTKTSYDGFSKTPCGFLTPQKTVIPKILVPSQNIIDNGVKGTYCEGNLNWTFSDENYSVTTSDSQSSVIIKKSTGVYNSKIILNPNDVAFAEEPADVDTERVVGGGAFQIVIGFYDTDIMSKKTWSEGSQSWVEEGDISTAPDNKSQPKVVFRLGDLEVSVFIDGRCVGNFLSGEKNSRTINLVSGTGEECIPQAKTASTDRGKTFTITVYPVWNGVVIQSGVQSSPNMIQSSAAYIPVIQNASALAYAEIKTLDNGTELPFNPLEPSQILIKTERDGKSVIPNLGDSSSELEFNAYNCSCSVAFSPVFFSKEMKMDHIIEGNKDVDVYQYKYNTYPIWTKNGTDYSLADSVQFSVVDGKGPSEFSNYLKALVDLKTESTVFPRVCPELFGDIVEMQETITATENLEPPEYTNGISNWTDYITNVTLSNSLDSGESGSITFDKYGATGGLQDAEVPQMVGKISVSVKGCYNTNGNSETDTSTSLLFKGYTWSANDNRNNSGSDVTVDLIGVQKRLEDITLINPPIFDGYKFTEVVTYLCNYAGVAFDLSNADQDTRLTISTDPIETVVFNWTTGMDVRQALDQICSNRGHGYFVKDGTLVFFERDSDGMPNYEGTDWSMFQNTNIQSVDMNPTLDDLRNQIMVIGMRQNTDASLKDIGDMPTFPITSMVKQDTVPEIPWRKGLCHTLAGFPTQEQIDGIAANLAKSSKRYEILGNTTVPGSNIKLLDRFMNEYLVTSVTHNIDLVSKSWTTTLGLQYAGE